MKPPASVQDGREAVLRPRKGLVLWKMTAIAAALLCLGSGVLLLFTGISTAGDSYFTYLPQGQNWGAFATIGSILPALAAVHCFVYLASRSLGVLRMTQVILSVAIAGMIGLTALGVVAVGEANSAGGSFANVRVALFCVVPPITAALGCTFMFLPLAMLKRRFVE